MVSILLLAGCSSKHRLMPTPDVYSLGIEQPFTESLPQELRTVDVNILYATDRRPVATPPHITRRPLMYAIVGPTTTSTPSGEAS